MQTQNVVRTIFSFASEGYDGAISRMTDAEAKIKEIKTEDDSLNKVLKTTDKLLAEQIKRWQDLDSTMNVETPKKMREEYANLNKVIEANLAKKAKAKAQHEANAKAMEDETKKQKEAADMARTYGKVLDELSKGLDNAEVSMDSLKKAKKALDSEMSKTNVGTEKYNELSKALAVVTKATNDVKNAQKEQVKQIGVAEDSVEALRAKVKALQKEWSIMGKSDPGLKAKAQELKAYADELTKAEQEVGIFNRNVGNYQSALNGLGGALNAIIPGLGSVATGIGAMTKQALAFIATPVGAIITAIVVALKALHEAFTRSAEGQEKLNVIMGYFSGVVTVLLDLVANLGEWLIKIFTEPKAAWDDFKKYVFDPMTVNLKALYNGAMGLRYAIVGIFDKDAREKSKEYFNQIKEDYIEFGNTAKEVYNAIGDKISEVQDKAKEGARIAELENQLKRDQLSYGDEIKQNENQIAELRRQAADKEKLTAQERSQLLNQAIALEKRNGEIRVSLAKQEYDIQVAKNALGKTNYEDLKKEQDLKNNIIQAETDSLNKQRELVAQTAEIRKSAADKARQAQEKANADYIKALQDKQKATEELRKAEVSGDTRLIEIQKKLLAQREAAFEKASQKRLTLSQSEKDELELQEYLHQQNLKAIREQAEDKKTNDYLKAVSDVRAAQAALLAAEKAGNAEQVAIYRQMLEMRQTELKKYNEEEIKLTEEQRLQLNLDDVQFRQDRVEEYKAIQTELGTLLRQYEQANSDVEREAIEKQIKAVEKKAEVQIRILEELGVDANEIVAGANDTAEQSQQSLTESLEKSLETIQKYAGKHQSVWFKLASSITGLVTKAFDFKKLVDEGKMDMKELKKAIIEVGAAVAMNGVDAAVGAITQSIAREKEALDEFYTWQEKRAQESHDRQSKDLQAKLDANEISETKYRLEQMKLDDKKAEEDKAREKEKANALYELEVKQFRVEQAQAAISTAIATGLAIMNAWAQGGPFVGPAFTAVISALGAAQIAAIYAQQPPEKPKFKKGGFLDFVGVDGPSHENGGVPVKIGDREVAEVEGGEGALIISKKAMRNSYMRRLLAKVEDANSRISGEQQEPGMFEEGGFLNYDEDFFQPARNSLKITKRRKRSIHINGKKVKLKAYGFNADAAIDAAAEEIAVPQWNAYIASEQAKLNARQDAIDSAMSERISQNETLRSMGITDLDSFNKAQSNKQAELDSIQAQIKVYEEAANARVDALKAELQYDEKIAEFEKQRQAAASDLAKTTEEFSVRVLGELRDASQITEDEYLSMLDQVKHGYGVTYSDIIELKKKQVEAIKAQIEEERNAELEAAKEVAQYREDALSQLRSEWEENYNALTMQIIENIEDASEAVSQLTGSDLERFNEILRISREIAKMEEDYQKNETLLNDGVVQSREERARLLAEQKRIQEELERKQQEAEEAKAAFEEERAKNMEAARQAYETANFSDLLEQIKALGSELQAEGNKWTLDKALAAELDDNLKAINATYDEQIARQDAIIDGLQAEIDQAQLLHDKKMAYIQEEEDALQESFTKQQAEIEAWLSNTTANLRSQATDLSSYLATLKVAGLEAGMDEYEKALAALNKDIDKLEATGGKKYETGGAIELGDGLFQVAGPAHSQGGVPVSVGGTKIAEVEGIEKMFAVNKLAAYDPEMMAALRQASEVNARYTGVPLIDRRTTDAFMLDYERQAALIGQQINQRPVHTYVTHRDIDSAARIRAAHRRSAWME